MKETEDGFLEQWDVVKPLFKKRFGKKMDVAKKRTYTKRLAENILEQLKSGDILNVSRRNDVTEEEIQRMIEVKSSLLDL